MDSRPRFRALLIAISCVAAGPQHQPVRLLAAAGHPDLSGTWTLNSGQSDMPAEVGFDPDWQDSQSKSAGRTGGGGGRSGGGGRGASRSSGGGGASSGGAIATNFESEEDSRKIRE